MKSDYHRSILLNESIDYLNLKNGGVYVDCTFGRGGHCEEILKHNESCKVVAIDRDVNNKKYADSLNQKYNNRVMFVNNVFSNISNVLEVLNIDSVDGFLYDLGISSMQVDNAEYGFSFNKEGPLSMQMGLNKQSAEDIVNSYSQNELADLIYQYGDEKNSRKIASAIVQERQNKRITTTMQLVKIVESVVPFFGKTHPATKTFQGIRIKVNDELNEITESLRSALRYLAVGGRIVVITFHSLEEKVVKGFMKDFYKGASFFNRGEAVHWHVKESPEKDKFINLVARGIVPTEDELSNNARARSAKMTVFEKIKDID